MNPVWIRALILVCVFGAVVLAAETLLRWLASRRSESKAINTRLQMIGSGTGQVERLNVLRRVQSTIPVGLPISIETYAIRLERMLIQAQVTIPTGRLMLILLIAPVAIFFLLLLLMAGWWGMGISTGRIVVSATICASPRSGAAGHVSQFASHTDPQENAGSISGRPGRLRSRSSGRSPDCRGARTVDRRNARSDRDGIRTGCRRSDLWCRVARCAPEYGRTLGSRRHAHVRRVALGPERDRGQFGGDFGESFPGDPRARGLADESARAVVRRPNDGGHADRAANFHFRGICSFSTRVSSWTSQTIRISFPASWRLGCSTWSDSSRSGA